MIRPLQPGLQFRIGSVAEVFYSCSATIVGGLVLQALQLAAIAARMVDEYFACGKTDRMIIEMVGEPMGSITAGQNHA